MSGALNTTSSDAAIVTTTEIGLVASKMLLSLGIAAALSNSFNSSINTARSKINTLKDRVDELTSTQAKIKAIPKLRDEIGQTEKQMAAANKRVRDLTIAMSQSDKVTKDQVKSFNAANRQVDDLNEKLSAQRNILKGNIDDLQKAGISADKYADAEKRLADQISRTEKRMQTHQSYSSNMDKIRAKREKHQTNLVGATAAVGTVMGLVSTARDIQQAQGDISTLGVSEQGLKSITNAALNFSRQYAGTTAPDFIRASYDIRSGIEAISEQAVGQFTAMSAMTAAATKSTTDVMTNLFAKGYGIYRQQFDKVGEAAIAGWNKMSAEEKDIKFGEYFSAGISSAVKQFRTDGQQMSAAITSLGASATSAGYSMQDQLAVLGTLQKTMSGAEAGTKFTAFLKSASKAGSELGLSFTDSNDQLLRVPEILNKLKEKYGDTLSAVEKQEITKAFGTDEAVKMIDLLYGDIDGLDKAADGLAKSMSRGKAATEEMAKAGQRGKDIELMHQQIQAMTATLATGVLPIINKVAAGIGWMANKISALAERFPVMTGALTSVIAVILTAAAALTALGWAGTYVAGGYQTFIFLTKLLTDRLTYQAAATRALAIAQRGWALVTKAATAAQWLWNAALSANPIGLVVMAVAALISLGVVLYKKFKPFHDLVDKIWNTFKKIGSSVGKFFGKFLGIGGGKTELRSEQLTKQQSESIVNSENISRTENRTEVLHRGVSDKKSKIDELNAPRMTPTAPVIKAPSMAVIKKAESKTGGNVTVHYSPTIQMQNGNETEVRKALDADKPNAVKQIIDAMAQERRVAYGS